MKDFDLFINAGDVKRQKPDYSLAKSLISDSIKRLNYSKKERITEDDAKFVFEDAYESIREAADAILSAEGYKSYSHEATISFLQRFKEFSFSELDNFDRFRKIRNGLKYYGKTASIEDAKEMIRFAEIMLKKLIEIYSKVVGAEHQ